MRSISMVGRSVLICEYLLISTFVCLLQCILFKCWLYLIQAVLCTLLFGAMPTVKIWSFILKFLVCRKKCGRLSTLQLHQRRHTDAQKAVFSADGLQYKPYFQSQNILQASWMLVCKINGNHQLCLSPLSLWCEGQVTNTVVHYPIRLLNVFQDMWLQLCSNQYTSERLTASAGTSFDKASSSHWTPRTLFSLAHLRARHTRLRPHEEGESKHGGALSSLGNSDSAPVTRAPPGCLERGARGSREQWHSQHIAIAPCRNKTAMRLQPGPSTQTACDMDGNASATLGLDSYLGRGPLPGR